MRVIYGMLMLALAGCADMRGIGLSGGEHALDEATETLDALAEVRSEVDRRRFSRGWLWFCSAPSYALALDAFPTPEQLEAWRAGCDAVDPAYTIGGGR